MFIEFPPVSTAEWEAAVRLDLKGREAASLGKILYRAEDVTPGEQPWPARAWQIWAEVSDLASARRALARGTEGLVVASPGADWLPLLDGVHLHTSAAEATLRPWAAGLSGTIEADSVSVALPGFRPVRALRDDLTMVQQIAAVKGVDAHCDWMVPVGPSYFEEIAKFRALRRLRPTARIVARTSRWHSTAYDPHVNLLRGTTEAMAAIIGGCDALIVGPFTEARGFSDELAERLALNTQLLLRDESYFGQVADPAAGSWYVESLTEELLRGVGADKLATAFVGVNRYPNPRESSPEVVTPERAMSALEECRLRSERAARRPTARLVRGSDEKMSRARAAFGQDFLVAGGFAIVESGDADLTVLCDADANYPGAREFPVVAAGPDFNRNSDHAAIIAEWQKRLGI